MSRVTAYSIGCEPSPSDPAETLVQDGWNAFLLFFAVSTEVDAAGQLSDLGVAVVRCVGCSVTRFGYPNDEGMPEHPLFDALVRAPSAVLLVEESSWASEVNEQHRSARQRLWPQAALTAEPFPALRHFVVCLKEATFECVAKDLRVEGFHATFREAYDDVWSKLNQS